MAESLSQEDFNSLAENLKQKFLEKHSDDSEIDPRDLERIRTDSLCVARFVRHNRGNLENAYNHMVESYKWRKSFGINDLQWTDLDENLWKSGMAWNRGFDKDGNNVCILNICLHRKDSKKAVMLQKWIAFSFEMQRKVYPNNKMCMIFDMTGAGLAQMDMDLIRFVINSFKIYFPDLLAWLLVYNMPWILHAAWKIVQSWLSESALGKVKFVTNDSLTEYIPQDQLLVKFGGTDTWEFDYLVEKERIFELAQSALKKEEAGGDNDELFPDDDDDPEDSLTREQAERGRQVRFSSGLPPTRQSRFGREDDLEENRSISPQQKLLQQGSSASRGFRRRQVSRLMSLQETKERRNPMQRSVTLEESAESASLFPNGSLPVSRRFPADPALGPVATIGDVMLSPSYELTFIGKKDVEVTSTLTLTNTSDNSVIYKIKTTAPVRYKVRPNVALVDGKSVAKVQVLFTPGMGKTSISQDKFLVQTYTFSPDANLPAPNKLIEFWRALPSVEIKEHRLYCRWVSDSPPKPVLKDQSPSKPAEPPTPLQIIERKMNNLAQVNAGLNSKVNKLLVLNYVIILLLVAVLLVTYFL